MALLLQETETASTSRPTAQSEISNIGSVVRKYWGFDSLRPLQEDAIRASLEQRDSLVVLPTGGGKSLCYQVPPLLTGRLDVVVSPLISLMKDQVDGLQSRGYPACALHSAMSLGDRRDTEWSLESGECRLLFVAPERLLAPGFIHMLKRLDVRSFAIDEAHCISHWGHNFRKDYRELASLRREFPGAAIHAFTATATPRVRQDIVDQLGLTNPMTLIGSFDRPNLTYRIVPLQDRYRQCVDVIGRHKGEAVIVYCLTRSDTEDMASELRRNGFNAAHYHAGMPADDRRETQEAFAAETLDVVAATVAFGMGIDRSNVRCVLHASMPQSIEHYQQETGRAGRDGLEAECVLLYSYADVSRWEYLIQRSCDDSHNPATTTSGPTQLLRQMQDLCIGPQCRHRALSAYFGQEYPKPNCGACDVCLDEVDSLEDATDMARTILTGVGVTGERFGAGYVTDVLVGANTERIRGFGHDRLKVYGRLSEIGKKQVLSAIYQLVNLRILTRTTGDRPVLTLNNISSEVMRGERTVSLAKLQERAPVASRFEQEAWEGVDRDLFTRLREWRRVTAAEREAPAFTVLEDSTLRDLARIRPSDVDLLSRVRGIGDKRLADFGGELIATVHSYCEKHGLSMDNEGGTTDCGRQPRPRSAARQRAFTMFGQGASVEDVAAELGRAESTVNCYLSEYIEAEKPSTIEYWVDAAACSRIEAVCKQAKDGRLKPIFEALGGDVPYSTIRLVMAHLKADTIDA